MPEFDWDDGNVRHLARHAVRPVEAEEAILDPAAIMLEIQMDEEERVKAIGSTRGLDGSSLPYSLFAAS